MTENSPFSMKLSWIVAILLALLVVEAVSCVNYFTGTMQAEETEYKSPNTDLVLRVYTEMTGGGPLGTETTYFELLKKDRRTQLGSAEIYNYAMVLQDKPTWIHDEHILFSKQPWIPDQVLMVGDLKVEFARNFDESSVPAATPTPR